MHASLRAQISELTLAISRQKQILDGLKTQLESLRHQLDSVVYPVLTLPLEITSEIFVHCLPTEREWDCVNPKEAPLLLAHVCSAWRQITLSTPALWTTLDIDAIGLHSSFSPILNSWLARARQCPLSVKIAGILSQIDKFDGFLETFRRHAGRMQSLEFKITLDTFDRMDTPPLEFPLLQNLSIRLFDEDEDLDGGEIHRAVWRFLLGEVSPSSITLPWEQLTKFTGELFTIAQCLEALRLMPNLVECHFAVYESEPREDSDTILSHPKLESLTLYASVSDMGGEAQSAEILEFLTLPALQVLHILGIEDFDEVELDLFLTRSSPPLRTLILRPLDSDGAIGIQDAAFLAMSSLTHLEIWYPGGRLRLSPEPYLHVPGTGLRSGHTRHCTYRGCSDYRQKNFERSRTLPVISSGLRLWFPNFRLPRRAASPVQKSEGEGMDIYIGTERNPSYKARVNSIIFCLISQLSSMSKAYTPSGPIGRKDSYMGGLGGRSDRRT
ncbi:hypothetical protein FB451DRAFT_1202140 [Mycena latifolia]|nr:hypothetical protein FB451DRAFT_1202140 [Mycena latifolia]